MIPKKVHYCWFGPKTYPKLIKKCMQTWNVHFPDFEFYFWDEANSPMDIPFMRQAYKAQKYAFMSDYLRFWALNNFGGIYLDTDIFVIKSMHELLDYSCFFAWETPKNHNISCGVIGSESKEPFIEAICKKYEDLEFRLDKIPQIISSRIVTTLFEIYPHKENVHILPFDLFYSFPYKQKEDIGNFLKYKTDNSYAIHLWNISWGTPYAKILDYCLYILRKNLHQ